MRGSARLPVVMRLCLSRCSHRDSAFNVRIDSGDGTWLEIGNWRLRVVGRRAMLLARAWVELRS